MAHFFNIEHNQERGRLENAEIRKIQEQFQCSNMIGIEKLATSFKAELTKNWDQTIVTTKDFNGALNFKRLLMVLLDINWEKAMEEAHKIDKQARIYKYYVMDIQEVKEKVTFDEIKENWNKYGSKQEPGTGQVVYPAGWEEQLNQGAELSIPVQEKQDWYEEVLLIKYGESKEIRKFLALMVHMAEGVVKVDEKRTNSSTTLEIFCNHEDNIKEMLKKLESCDISE